jgi:hypothetical protein
MAAANPPNRIRGNMLPPRVGHPNARRASSLSIRAVDPSLFETGGEVIYRPRHPVAYRTGDDREEH